MKLKINKKWKWAAMGKENVWYFYKGKPILLNHIWMPGGKGCEEEHAISRNLFENVSDWRKSLIRIND